MDLKGKTVVVTGATRGLGRALVVEFAKAGCRVAGLGRDSSALESIKADLPKLVYTPIVCDVGDSHSVDAAVKKVIELHGGIDVLFNNAALYPRVGFLEESSEDWTDAISANINGVAYCCKAVLPAMISAKKGRIYNLGSWAYLGPIQKSAAYSASKGAIHALTLAISEDLRVLDLDIQVHEWIPGHLRTRMSESGGIDPSVSAKWAVAMVQADAATKDCTIFENNYEWVPPRRIKDRILDLIPFRS